MMVKKKKKLCHYNIYIYIYIYIWERDDHNENWIDVFCIKNSFNRNEIFFYKKKFYNITIGSMPFFFFFYSQEFPTLIKFCTLFIWVILFHILLFRSFSMPHSQSINLVIYITKKKTCLSPLCMQAHLSLHMHLSRIKKRSNSACIIIIGLVWFLSLMAYKFSWVI